MSLERTEQKINSTKKVLVQTASGFNPGIDEDKSLRDFIANPYVQIGIRLKQFSTRAIPTNIFNHQRTIQVGNVAEIKKYCWTISDAELAKLKLPILIQQYKNITVDLNAINKILVAEYKSDFINDLYDFILKELLSFKSSQLNELVHNVDPNAMYNKIMDIIKKNSVKFQKKIKEIALKYSVPEEVIEQIAIPYLLSQKARDFLQPFEASWTKNFPLLHSFFKGTFETFRSTPRFIQFYDRRFPHYDANLVEGTGLVMGAGPQNEQEIQDLFDNTVFNDAFPIRHIMAVTNVFKEASSTNANYDIANYFLFHKGEAKKFGKYNVVLLSYSEVESGQCSTKITLEIENALTNKKRELTVYFFKTPDNQSLNLNHKKDFARYYKIFQKHVREQIPLLVHCASGVGRSGHVVFSFMLAKEAEKNLKNPLIVLKRLRAVRPAAVFVESQFSQAIDNAILLNYHEQALNQSYRQLDELKQSLTLSRSSLENSSSAAGHASPVSELKKQTLLAENNELITSTLFGSAPEVKDSKHLAGRNMEAASLEDNYFQLSTATQNGLK